MKKVSIIIPIYNVERYLSKCLESVSLQTYSNLEIILVYDKCSDNSLRICQEWEKKDNRFHVIINERRCGLGEARNVGLRAATGEYIMYLDSDDWCEDYFVIRLVEAIEETKVDYVSYGGIWWNTEKGIEFRHSLPAGKYASNIEREIVLLREFPAVWKKIYRREWLINNGLYQPALFCYEDWGYNMPFVLSCNNIEIIPGAAVHYRANNTGSLSNSTNQIRLAKGFKQSLEFGISELKRRNLYSKHKIAIYCYFYYNYAIRRNKIKKEDLESKEFLEDTKKWFLEKIDCKEFNEGHSNIAFGSFATRWVAQQSGTFSTDLEYFGFTSLISAMTCGKEIVLESNNLFRKEQIEKDIEGIFRNRIQDIQEPTTIFIDFLDERNGVLKADTYIADSEAYREAYGIRKELKKLEYDTEEFEQLWKIKCEELVQMLLEKKEYIRIYLLQNRMALKYGDFNKLENFSNNEELLKINNHIQRMEEEFITRCGNKNIKINYVEMPEKYQFTDVEFMYGCYPHYMNNFLYTYMGLGIAKKYIQEMQE